MAHFTRRNFNLDNFIKLEKLYKVSEEEIRKKRAEGGINGGRGNKKPSVSNNTKGLITSDSALKKAADQTGISHSKAYKGKAIEEKGSDKPKIWLTYSVFPKFVKKSDTGQD